MTDERNLLLNIAADPEDDLVRLAYADLMEEQGKAARAEFIRLQCRLARDEEDEHLGPGERLALKERERELIAAHGREWAGDAADCGPQFRRGFVERVTLRMVNVEAGMECLQKLREAMPTIAGLKVDRARYSFDSQPDWWMQRMLRHEACRGLRELDLEGHSVGPDDIRALAEADKPALERLNLRDCAIRGWNPLEALAASPHMGRLRELNLARNTISLFQQSFADAAFPRLEVLNLEKNTLYSTMLGVIARAPFMRRLRQLELAGNETLGDAAVTVLAEASQLPALRRLGLRDCHITDAGVAALAQSPRFAAVESLTLGDNQIGPQSAQALAASPHLGKLKTLEIDGTYIGNEGLRALIASEALGGLRNLDATNVDNWEENSAISFDANGVPALEGLARLHSLKLEDNDINAESLAALLASEHLGALRELSLADNPIGSQGACALAEARWLSGLESLTLARCGFDADAVRMISDCTGFEALRYLDIRRNMCLLNRLQFNAGADSAVGAVGPMSLGLRTKLERDHPRHVTVRE